MEADRGADPDENARPPGRLVLLRHAKSSWDGDLPDHGRPLSDRGRRDATAVGHWLAAHVGAPDLVLCSSAVRTRQTWARATQAEPLVLGRAPVRVEDAIYQAWPDRLLALLHDVGRTAGTVVLVGHAPGVPDLADRLNRVTGPAPVGEFRTSAVAVFAVTGAWSELGPQNATLTTSAVPRG